MGLDRYEILMFSECRLQEYPHTASHGLEVSRQNTLLNDPTNRITNDDRSFSQYGFRIETKHIIFQTIHDKFC